MHTGQPPFKSGQTSPSPLFGNDELSQISLNPSLLQKTQQANLLGSQLGAINQRKRLKFDELFEEVIENNVNQIPQTQSQQQVEIEFHLSNCLIAISDFFRSQSFKYLFVTVLVLFLVNCTLEAAQISDTARQITQKIDLGIQIFFSFSIFIKMAQLQKQQIFWLVLDIMTNVCAYLAYGLSDYTQPVRYLRAAKILRLLMIVKEVTYLQVPAAKLINSLSSVGKILFPAALFIYFYAIIGLYSFRDYEYSKCRDPANKYLTSNWTVYSDSIFLCGQKSCPIVNGTQFQCLNPIDFGVQPNPQQVRNIVQGYGLMKYNNIFFSLFSTFKQTFITGSSRLMILGKQVTNYFYVLIYYLSFIYLLAYIYLNIFYGLMITNEEQAKPTRRESSFELQLQRKSTKRNLSQEIQNDKLGKYTQKPLAKHTSQISLQKRFSNKVDNIYEVQSQKSEFEQVINFSSDDKSHKLSMRTKGQSYKLSQFAQRKLKQNPALAEEQSQLQQLEKLSIIDQKLLTYGSVMKKYFLINHIIIILCSINILTDYEGQTQSVKLVVDAIDFVFFWIYMAEMIFRIVIHLNYISEQPFDRAFKLDLLLFGFCTGGLLYQVVTSQNFEHFLMASDDPSKLLRTLKYLRIFILISSTPYFTEARIIFNSTLEAVYSVRYLSALWLLVLITCSIMGYHMFQGKTKVDHFGRLDMNDGQAHQIGFEGIVDSFIYTVFIFFNEEWDWFLFQQYINQEVLIVIWQLIVLVIGLQVLSKYFMASLMKELGDKLNEEEELAEQNQNEILQNESQLEKILSQQSKFDKIVPVKDQSKQQAISFKLKQKQSNFQPSLAKKVSNTQNKRISINVANGILEVRNITHEDVKKQRETRVSMMRDLILRQKQNSSDGVNISDESHPKRSKLHKTSNKYKSQFTGEPQCLESSRIKLFLFLKSRFFIVLKVIVILISIVSTLVMNPQKDPNLSIIQTLTQIWYATMVFFCLDIVLSIFAFGLLKENSGYLRNWMNWIYLLVFIIQILSLIPNLAQNTDIQFLLSFKILRIFIFIELKYEADADMRLTMVAFRKLLPKVFNLLVITIIMYGFFAILLVKLFKDDYYYCDGYQHSATIRNNLECMSWGGSWVRRKMNVSNIFNSLIYLFLLATTQGWSVQAIESASLTGKGNEPSYGQSLWMEYFFSVFFFFGNMIMLNVFIGLSVYNFQKIKSQVTGLARLSKDNKMWFSIKNTIHRLNPKMKDSPPQNCVSKAVHTFINSRANKITSIILLIIFMINMSFYSTEMSDQNQKILDVVLETFIYIFIFEYCLLWIAYGLRSIKQRIFIFATLGTLYFIILLVMTHTIDLQQKTVRILYGIAICILSIRSFALMNGIDFVRKMINSLLTIFPQTANIWLLIFVVLFSYATIGIYFFGYLKISPELNEFDQNYTDLPSAIYALIKFSTLESPILQIIESTSGIEPNSVCFDMYTYQDYAKHGRMGCGSPIAGYIFFLSFQVIYTFILLSTLLAVIVDAYSQVRREEESMVNKFLLEEVQKQWENYDPEATGYISYRDFWIFTAKLVKIYKVNKEELLSHQTKQSFLKSLQIPIYEDQHGVLSFQFHEVVEALTRIVIKQKMGPNWDSKQADKVFQNHSHGQSQIKLFKKSAYDSSHVLTLIILKSGLKTWKRKTANVQNTKNLQNLLSIAKRQNKKTQKNGKILKQTMQMNQQINLTEQKGYLSEQKVPIKSCREPNSLQRKGNNLQMNKITEKQIEDEEIDIEEIK